MSTRMEKIFNAYTSITKKTSDEIRFVLFDGKTILPSDTPLSLGVEHNDYINAMPVDTGGAASSEVQTLDQQVRYLYFEDKEEEDEKQLECDIFTFIFH